MVGVLCFTASHAPDYQRSRNCLDSADDQEPGLPVSLHDHNYIPGRNALTSEVKEALLSAPKGDWTPPGDLQFAVKVAELAQSNSKNISVQTSSKTRISDLKSDDNFIFLGSPRSDPWVSLFNDRLETD
jgi:hypothetical protein